jgi:hypothetical protein
VRGESHLKIARSRIAGQDFPQMRAISPTGTL